jgi:hypothetical protein
MARRIGIGRLQYRAGIGVDDDGRNRRIVTGGGGGSMVSAVSRACVGVGSDGGDRDNTG